MTGPSTNTFYTSFRDSLVGQSIYYISGRKLLKPRILRDDYVIPEKYFDSVVKSDTGTNTNTLQNNRDPTELTDSDKESQWSCVSMDCPDFKSGLILVDWDGDDDPDNPQNWPALRKALITIQVSALTTSAYMASAIFAPSEDQMLVFFNTTEVKLMLGLTLFVWGYGISPMFVSAMSESPHFDGRRTIFLVAEFLFLIFQIPTALSNHLATFVVLRLLAGLVAGPPLSNGPACLGDLYSFPYTAYVIICWSFGAVCGPYIGPLIGAALTHGDTWRWTFWFLLIQAGVVFTCMLFLFPETSSQALLMKKAAILRKLTGNPNIRAPGDIKRKETSIATELKAIVWYPIQLCIREPVLDLLNVHLTLVYSVIYLFFEGFPIVFLETYHFTLVEMGCAYASLIVGIFVAIAVYSLHVNRNIVANVKAGHPKTPEQAYGYPALAASISVFVGLFIFGWSATPTAHWIGTIIGANIFAFGTFILFQSYMSYIGTLWPTRFASAIASNTVLRSMVGGAFPLFGRIFFEHTGSQKYPVGWGGSILGFVAVAMVGLPVYFLMYGAQLRERTLARWGVTQ